MTEARRGGQATPRLNLGALLLHAFRWFDQGLVAALNEAGWEIRRSHSLVLAHMDPGGTRPAEIARRIGVSRQAIHQTIGELEKMGLVEQVPDPAHQRAKLLVLTPRGRENLEAALRAFAELEKELARQIGARRVSTLRAILEADWGPPRLSKASDDGEPGRPSR